MLNKIRERIQTSRKFPCGGPDSRLHRPLTSHAAADGQYCTESDTEFARRMRNMCSACGKRGHLICFAKLGAGESVAFAAVSDQTLR